MLISDHRAIGASLAPPEWDMDLSHEGMALDVLRLVASLGKDTQAAAPIAWRSEVWGALWVATMPGGRPLTAGHIPRVVGAANDVARALDAAAAAG